MVVALHTLTSCVLLCRIPSEPAPACVSVLYIGPVAPYAVPATRTDLTGSERQTVLDDLMREVMSLWQTDELRRHKPTPLDGKGFGFTGRGPWG